VGPMCDRLRRQSEHQKVHLSELSGQGRKRTSRSSGQRLACHFVSSKGARVSRLTKPLRLNVAQRFDQGADCLR
jgi:hypothetical protein